MKRNSKTILFVLSAILLMTVSLVGTFAFFTSQDEVTNTYTVKNVLITLDEAKTNEIGLPVNSSGSVVADPADAVRVKGNDYSFLPGHTYIKDPTVTVMSGSQECYVRLLVTFSKPDAIDEILQGEDISKMYVGYNESLWSYVETAEDTENNTRTYTYQYHETVTAPSDADLKLPPLFSGIYIPGETTREQMEKLNGLEIFVIAQAHIEPTGFQMFTIH